MQGQQNAFFNEMNPSNNKGNQFSPDSFANAKAQEQLFMDTQTNKHLGTIHDETGEDQRLF